MDALFQLLILVALSWLVAHAWFIRPLIEKSGVPFPWIWTFAGAEAFKWLIAAVCVSGIAFIVWGMATQGSR